MDKINIQRINKKYIKDNYAQVLFSFKKEMIIDKPETKEELFQYNKKKGIYKNKYLNDARRNEFPYGNIAVHRELRGFRIYNIANQILDYDTTYRIRYSSKKNDKCTYCRLVKDSKDTLLIIASNIKDLDMNIEKIKNLSTLGKLKIKKGHNPKFVLSINKDITRQDLLEGRQLGKNITKKRAIKK